MTARRLLVGWLVLVVALVLWAVVGVAAAAHHLLAAKDGLQQLREGGDVELTAVSDTVAEAAEHARSARGWTAQPAPALAARLPLVGPLLAVERDVATASAALLGSAEEALMALGALEVRDRSVDLGLLAQARRALLDGAREARGPVGRLVSVDLDRLPGPARGPVSEARTALAAAEREVVRAGEVLPALEGLLGAHGPRTIAVVVMNNAELRGAGGYGGSVAFVRTDEGRFDVGAFVDPDAFEAEPEVAVRVSAPEDVRRRYGVFLADTTLWKNALMSADQPSSASVACAVLRVTPGVPCDAAVLLDVPALADLMTLSGPVALPDGSEIGGEDLVRALLVEAYEDVPDADEAQAARRAALRGAADRALSDLLDGGDLPAPLLARLLGKAAAGRHLAVWSAVEHEQRALQDVGVAGSADPDGADLSLVAFNQLVAGKLDYYVDREVDVDVTVGRTSAHVVQRVSLGLELPDGLTEYVLGTQDGRLVGLLDIAVSADARSLTATQDGTPLPVEPVPDTGSLRVAVPVDLSDGGAVTFEVAYEVPVEDGRYRLEVLPQPLARDARLTLDVAAEPGLRATGATSYAGPFDRARAVEVTVDVG